MCVFRRRPALAVVPVQPEGGLPSFPVVYPRIEAYVRQSRTKSTLRGYSSDWREFEAWCAEQGVANIPADQETICGYLAACADRGLKVGSIQRRLSAIAAAHSAREVESPTNRAGVRLCMAGIRRALGVHQQGKAALLTADIAALLAHLPDNLLGVRDRALLLTSRR